MTEQTLKIEIPLIMPGLIDQADGRLKRLEAELQNRKGVSRAHVEGEESPMILCLHYDPRGLSSDEVRHLAQRAGAAVASRYQQVFIPVDGMDCSDCVTVLEHGVGRIEGVLGVSVSYAAQKMRVEFDSQRTSYRAIERRLTSLGYEIPAIGWRSWYRGNRELLLSLLAGLLVLSAWLGAVWGRLPLAAVASLYAAAYVAGGWHVARHAWQALRERRFDTDLLMIMAALGAALLGDFAEGGLLLFLFSLGHSLEERALDRARAAVRALADLTPKTAQVKRSGKLVETSVELVELGEVVLVRPGVRLPVDGVVVTGQSGVDQSPVTGESMPVERGPDDPVFAGSINGAGALEVRVTRLAKDSTLARVMKMVEVAQVQKSPTQQVSERFERIFVPVVLGLAALAIVLPPLWGVPFRVAFLRGMTVLVAASPCALALGAPASILAGIAQAARHGVLVKGGAHLEALGQIKAIAFDKTGTVTRGRPELTDVVPGQGVEAADLLALAAAVEGRSAHPLAQAIAQAAPPAQGPQLVVTGIQSLTGLGLRAEVDGQPVWVGSLRLLEDNGFEIDAEARAQAAALEDAGKTVVLVGRQDRLLGVLAVADRLRPEAPACMAALQKLGVRKTVMLTGDNARVAAAMARQAGLADFRADLMPEDKVTALRELGSRFGPVAMVGDGVNDAPALAHATVGIALGGAATDVALETADVVLMGNDLTRLPYAVGLGRATRAIILQNLVLALGVMGLLSVAALLGLAGMGAAVIFHEGSTIAVVLNALRLLRFNTSEVSPRP